MIKQLQKKIFVGMASCLLGIFSANAQSSKEISDNLSKDERVKSFSMEPNRGTPSLIKMNTSGETLLLSNTPAFLNTVLGMGQETKFTVSTAMNTNGIEVSNFQQYTKGIKVEHGVFKAVSKNNIVFGLTAEYYSLSDAINVTPSLNEKAALQMALDHVGAKTYAWEYIKSLGNSPELTAAYNEVFPTGELVLVDNYLTKEIDITLAYKFNVYAAEPLSRADIYVDAANGKILLLDAIIKHADAVDGKDKIKKEINNQAAPVSRPMPFAAASGDTRYAGNRTFATSQDADGNWVLSGTSPSGIENETLSYEGLGGLPISAPVSDFAVAIIDGDGDLLNPETADNNWTAEEHRKNDFSLLYTPVVPVNGAPSVGHNEVNNDDIALDAHWGTEVVLDYWKNVHNRLSYDNLGTKVTNYVHYGDAYDNAFWNGTAMTYGDGSYQGGQYPNGGSFAPLTSMDVCAHEIGHGICEYTANLVYQRESGAMNEGFSDIWAAAVEFYVLEEIDASLNYDPWGIGEQIDERDGGLEPGSSDSRALRWMDDPKAAGNPDSYGGENWSEPECGTPTLANDQCGVHNNSGVLNKWFYFLVTGSGQSFSPGFNKASADDLISDGGNQYTIQGIGFTKAAKIAYLAETMLSPNAKFIEMRDASILSAQILYGLGSNEEVQTTNSWFAVDIGEAFSVGDPNTILFNASNVALFEENNLINGCDDSNVYSVYISGVLVNPSATINISTAGSTATLGVDFDLSTTSLTFSDTEIQTVDVIIYDDTLIEDGETIKLSYVYNGAFFAQTYTIADNDFGPRTGTEDVDLLATELFSASAVPTGWSVISLGEGNNTWKFNGDSSAAGRAYVADGSLDVTVPFYDSNSPSNVILRSPMISAGATSDVTITFDWEAGGELEDPAGPGIFDYGEFMYSLDGSNYVSVQQFHGSGPLGAVTESGTYTGVINELDGKPFFLGWRWYNDTNAGTAFSFAIDNVHVKATPAGVETEANETSTTKVYAGDSVFFVSDSDQALIAKIDNASEDLGCVTLKVVDAGESFEIFTNINTARPSKSFSITTSNESASYDVTMYFTEEELTAFSDSVTLIPMKVNSNNIDDAIEDPNNIQYNGVLTDVNDMDGYKAYTGTFTGSGTMSIVQEFNFTPVEPTEEDTTPDEDPTDEDPIDEDPTSDDTACKCSKHGGKHACDDKNENHYVKGSKGNYNAFIVSPNPAVTDVNITSDANIMSLVVYNLYGVVVSTINNIIPANDMSLQVSNLNDGMYIVNVITADGEVFVIKFIKI